MKKFKKVFSLLLVGAMTLSMAACGSSSKKASTSKKGGSVKVGIITDTGGVNDGSFNQSAWEGLQRAEKDLGIEVKYLESKNEADYKPNIETFVDNDYDMIICIGFALADALKEEATANPDQKFAIVDDATNKDLPNVTCLMFEASQSSYLAGYAAGLTTKTNTIGFVLGMSNDMMHEFGYGYTAGAIDANPNVKVLQNNANSFSDSAAGKTAANTMISGGADVIFHAAGATGLGVIDACKEAGIWAIGVDSDQSSVAPKTILTSAMKRVDNAVYEIAKETKEGTVKPGVKTFSLKDGGVDIAPTTDNLDPEVLKKVEAVKQDILDGKVTVPSTKKDFEAKYGKVYTLND
ncbi:MAG TPA: BMP family ABC transporter substrate-binding protein [Lachnospiraceae bacterium]|jgi:basic membrane protein A|nr:BMP family ABC transporter substrate-binding protein [Lachnospiraceae bacterium]HBE08365.1 BMP family ABC transporter substrate-binding protein [Lachnospiraceae bacterium]